MKSCQACVDSCIGLTAAACFSSVSQGSRVEIQQVELFFFGILNYLWDIVAKGSRSLSLISALLHLGNAVSAKRAR